MVTNALTERRAQFIYDGARLAAMAAQAPIVYELWAAFETERAAGDGGSVGASSSGSDDEHIPF